MTIEIKKEKFDKKRKFRGIPVKIEINEDIDFELHKIADSRKITINRLMYEILKEWLENYDTKRYEEESRV